MPEEKLINTETRISLTSSLIVIRTNYVEEVVPWVLDTGVWGGSETLWTSNGVWNTI